MCARSRKVKCLSQVYEGTMIPLRPPHRVDDANVCKYNNPPMNVRDLKSRFMDDHNIPGMTVDLVNKPLGQQNHEPK